MNQSSTLLWLECYYSQSLSRTVLVCAVLWSKECQCKKIHFQLQNKETIQASQKLYAFAFCIGTVNDKDL